MMTVHVHSCCSSGVTSKTFAFCITAMVVHNHMSSIFTLTNTFSRIENVFSPFLQIFYPLDLVLIGWTATTTVPMI
jgi:hypothetical protein